MKMVLTGERPVGRRYAFEALKNRFVLQERYRCFFMIADYQALTTHGDRSREIEGHVWERVLDYLAAGFDPERGVCFLQSQVPQLAELTTIFGHLVPLSRLLEHPEIARSAASATCGFMSYPVSQAADILLFRPALVPVGPDQRANVELAQEVAARFNRMYGGVFPIPEGMYGKDRAGTGKDLELFRTRRREFEEKKGLVRDILNLGGSEARVEGQRTLEEVKDAMGLNYKELLG